jgi:hypothetical protein
MWYSFCALSEENARGRAGGRISVESVEGAGITFTLELPLEPGYQPR